MPASAATATKACLDALKRLLPWTTGRPSAPMTPLGTRSMSRCGLNRIGVLHIEGVTGRHEAKSDVCPGDHEAPATANSRDTTERNRSPSSHPFRMAPPLPRLP